MKKYLLLFLFGGFVSFSHAEIWSGEKNIPLKIEIPKTGFYNITACICTYTNPTGNTITTTFQTFIDGVCAPGDISSLSATGCEGGAITGQYTSLYYFTKGLHTISGHLDQAKKDSPNYWSYTVQPVEQPNYADALACIEKQLTSLQEELYHFVNLDDTNVFIGEQNKPLEFDITTPGFYEINLNTQLNIGGLAAREGSAVLTTLINDKDILLTCVATGGIPVSASRNSLHYFSPGHYQITAKINLYTSSGNNVDSSNSYWMNTDNSIWFYSIKLAGAY